MCGILVWEIALQNTFMPFVLYCNSPEAGKSIANVIATDYAARIVSFYSYA
jgi:hypothetical protein